jgi:hypothetical protein
VPIEAAIGASNRVEHMNFAEHFAAGSHFTSAGSLVGTQVTGDTDIEVKVQTLDSMVESLGLDRVDVVKIDVEGFETDVLTGGQRTFANFTPVALIEFNSWAFTTHRRQLPQEALDQVLTTFPFVYVLERHGDRVARITTDQDRLSLLRANMLHGCVDNLLCGFRELGPNEPPYGAVWQEFTLAPNIADVSAASEDPAAELAENGRRVAALMKDLEALRLQSARLEKEYAATLETVSWRVTRPLRTLRALSRRG